MHWFQFQFQYQFQLKKSSLKNTQKTSLPLKWDYTIHCNENENGNEK